MANANAVAFTDPDCRWWNRGSRTRPSTARTGCHCHSGITERTTSWPTRGTGLYIPGNGVRALEALGLANTVLARAVCMSHQRVLDHTGRQLAEIELAKVWNRVGVCVGIARGELHHVLLEGAADVPMRLGTTVTTLSQQDGGVDVTFADGSTGTYDLVSAFSTRRRTRIRWVLQRTHRRDRIRALPVPLRNLALRLAGTAIYRRDYRMLFEKP